MGRAFHRMVITNVRGKCTVTGLAFIIYHGGIISPTSADTLIQINDPLTPSRHFPWDPVPERSMDTEPSDFIVGLLMLVFGIVGLFLASGAMDDEMYVFGLTLFGFATAFEFGLLRRHFDKAEARRHG